jgi:hypothetical protein
MTSSHRPFITVVSGLPRSGTSMMMQMLDAGGIPALTDHAREADEDNLRGYYELDAVKRTKQDASWLSDAPGKAVKLIYMLLYDLPPTYQYRVIFMERELDEVLASQQSMLARRNEKGAGVSRDELRRIFKTQLDKVRAWLATRPEFKVWYVDYQEVVREPARLAIRLSDFLGGGLDVASMAAAVEPSLYRQRRST